MKNPLNYALFIYLGMWLCYTCSLVHQKCRVPELNEECGWGMIGAFGVISLAPAAIGYLAGYMQGRNSTP